MNKKQLDNSSNRRSKFIDAARELGCDEDEARFEEKLKQVARHKPPPEPPKPARAKTKKPAV